MEHRFDSRMKMAARLVPVVGVVVTVGIALAAVDPHHDWVSTLKPADTPGPELTLALEGATKYVILVPATPTGQDQKAAEELAKWLGKMTGATFPIMNEGRKAPAGPVISTGRTAHLAGANFLAAARCLRPRGHVGLPRWQLGIQAGRGRTASTDARALRGHAVAGDARGPQAAGAG